MTTDPRPRTDGRTARTDRTRESIVDAHLALIREGDLKPTGERIAERAGVSLRTLWVSFKDMEALFEASGATVLAQERAAFQSVDPTMALPARITAFCAQRAALLEFLAPQARAAKIRAPFSNALRRNLSRHVHLVRVELAATFAAELGALGPTARAHTESALLAASTWATWSFLRDDLEQARPEATAVMEHTVTALLAPQLDQHHRSLPAVRPVSNTSPSNVRSSNTPPSITRPSDARPITGNIINSASSEETS